MTLLSAAVSRRHEVRDKVGGVGSAEPGDRVPTGRVESDHGRNLNAYRPNYAGAVGPMQFLPATFTEYSWAAGHTGPDILEPHDAIFAAAAMLSHNGIATDIRGAIFSYNHADWYVDRVLSWARRYGWTS